jgi:hypothetical protein
MATYCTQCKTKIGFFRQFKDFSADYSIVVLCKACWRAAVERIQAKLGPFQISKGYTRVKAVLSLQLWQIPSFCIICSSQEEPLSKRMLSLSTGNMTMSIPLYLCRRCFNYNLAPLMYIRYRLDSNNLTLDIGNPEVAEKYLRFLNAELANIKRNFEGQTGKVELTIRGSNEKFSVPAEMLRPHIDKLGVQEVRKVSPGDPDFY